MGLIFNGNGDVIKAVDGSLTVEGLDLGGSTNINAGIGTFSGNLNVGGVLTYEDVKNVDAIGIITARDGIRVTGGSVGIGTITPTSNLHVANYSGDATIEIESGSSASSILRFGDTDNNDVGQIEYDHSDNSIRISNSNTTERLRIKSDGKVGINTNNPGANLTVWANDGVTDTDVFQVRSKTGAFNIQVSDSNASNPEWAIRTYANEPIVFKQATVERLRINSSGAVSIASNNYTLGHSSAKLRVGSESGSTQGTAVFGSGDTTIPALTLTNWDGAQTQNWSVIQFDNSGWGNFQIGGTAGADAFSIYDDTVERLRIDSDGRLRIGNTTQNQYTAADDLIVGTGNGDRGLTLYSGSSDAGVIAFSDGTTDTAYRSGQIIYDHSADAMDFRTNGNYIRLKLTSTGQLEATSAADVRLTLGSSGTAGTNNSVHVRADSADLKFMAASGGTTIFETNGTETLRIKSAGGFTFQQGNTHYPTDFIGGTSNGRNYVRIKAGNTTSGHSSGFKLIHSDGNGVMSMFINHNDDHGHFMNEHQGGDILFYTNQSGSSLEKLRITSTGEVRIGGNEGGYKTTIIDKSNRTTTAETSLLLYAKHDGSGTTGAGFGTGIRFWGDRASGNIEQNMGRIMCTAEVNSGTTLSGALSFETSVAGGLAERLRISSAGNVTKPHQVAWTMHSSLGMTNFASGDKVGFNQAGTGFGNFNSTRNHSSVSTSGNSFTAPVAGLYLTIVTMFFYTDNMSNICSVVPRINNTQLSNGNDNIFYFAVQEESDTTAHSGSLLLQLAKDDVLTVHARTGNTGTHKYYGAHCQFQGCLIG